MLCPACGHAQRADAPEPCRCIVIGEPLQPASPNNLTREQARQAVLEAREIADAEWLGLEHPRGRTAVLHAAICMAYVSGEVTSS